MKNKIIILLFIFSLSVLSYSNSTDQKENKIDPTMLEKIVEQDTNDNMYFDIDEAVDPEYSSKNYDEYTIKNGSSKLEAVIMERDKYGIIANSITSLDEDYLISDRVFEFTNVDDSLGGYNRRMYAINTQLDDKILYPVSRIYKHIIPKPIRTGISNFSSNFSEIPTTVNSLLQLKFGKALNSAGRFLINSTIGLAGTIDVAKSFGLKKDPETFGDTLGHYGVYSGSYLVLPVLGPSTIRDAGGMFVDSAMTMPVKALVYDKAFYETNILDQELTGPIEATINGINARSLLNIKYGDLNSPFEYDLVKALYFNYRKLQIIK
jgi:phospholipid-binding lipoprotein MlaA